jgi:hypothetical protein
MLRSGSPTEVRNMTASGSPQIKVRLDRKRKKGLAVEKPTPVSITRQSINPTASVRRALLLWDEV